MENQKVKIFGVFFEVNDKGIYTHLTDVFKYSAKKNLSLNKVDLEIIELPIPEIEGKRHQQQMIKQKKWTELALAQTQPYIAIDTDMIITGDITEAFQHQFDVAYTGRHGFERKPLNGGMIFCRPNERTNNFWEKWLKLCETAYEYKNIREELNKECKGFAQSCLWHLINSNLDCNIIELPCQEYNACDEEWNDTDDNTKAYHIKGRMRKALWQNHDIPSSKVYNMWMDYAEQYNSSN